MVYQSLMLQHYHHLREGGEKLSGGVCRFSWTARLAAYTCWSSCLQATINQCPWPTWPRYHLWRARLGEELHQFKHHYSRVLWNWLAPAGDWPPSARHTVACCLNLFQLWISSLHTVSCDIQKGEKTIASSRWHTVICRVKHIQASLPLWMLSFLSFAIAVSQLSPSFSLVVLAEQFLSFILSTLFLNVYMLAY